MKLYGQDIGFRRSIWAENALKKTAPDGDVRTALTAMTSEDPMERSNAILTFCATMHSADERFRKWRARCEGTEYKETGWTKEDWENLTEEETAKAIQEALKVGNGDAKQEVKAEPVGKNAEGQPEEKS